MIAQLINNISSISNLLTEQDYLELKASGLSDEHILKTGHFSIKDAQEAAKKIGIKHRGLAFNYCDPEGKPYLNRKGKPWMRVKPRDWDETIEDPPKYLSQSKEGNRPYFSRLHNWEKTLKKTRIPIYITEGEKKADSLCAHDLACIGLSGVSCWKDSSPRPGEICQGEELPESRVLPELQEINWDNRLVYICFDSDVVHKYQVRIELFNLASWLQSKGAVPYVLLLPTEVDGDKNGADDFVVKHGIFAFHQMARFAIPAINYQGKKPSLNLPIDPKLPLKTAMICSILKESWAYRPSVGWYQWSGSRWIYRPNDVGGMCPHLEAQLIDFMNAQGWEEQGSMGLSSLVRHMRAKLLIFSQLWNPANKLAFTNGTLNLTTGEFSEGHEQVDYLTTVLPYNYDPTAQCPTWLAFLDEALKSDRGAIDLVQAFFKWVLLPKPHDRNVEIERCFDLVGPPGTGKSTFLDVLTWLVGSEACGAVGQDTFRSIANLASLMDVKVAIDRDASGYIADVGLLNKIISNDPIQVKRLYKDVASVRLRTVLVRAYNRFLDVPDGSEGLNRRIIALTFANTPKRIDPQLGEKLQAEMPGIFAWAWAVAAGEMKRRLLWAGTVESVAEASIKRFEANNPEYLFLAECFPQGALESKPRELYRGYVDWCKETGYQSKKERKFYESIQLLGCILSEKTKGYRFYTIPPMEKFDVIAHLGIARPTIYDPGRNEPEKSEGRNGGRNESTPNPYPELDREIGRNEAQNFLGDDQKNSASEKVLVSVSPYLPTPYQESVSDTFVSPSVSPSDETSPISPSDSISSVEMPIQDPPETRPKTTNGLRKGDFCKYCGPQGAMKVTCQRKPLRVLALREQPDCWEAEIKADGWHVTYWVKCNYLRWSEPAH